MKKQRKRKRRRSRRRRRRSKGSERINEMKLKDQKVEIDEKKKTVDAPKNFS